MSLEAPRPAGLHKKHLQQWAALCKRNPTSIILFEWGPVYLALNNQAKYLTRETGKSLLFADELEFCAFTPAELPGLLRKVSRLNTVLVCQSLTDESKQYYT